MSIEGPDPTSVIHEDVAKTGLLHSTAMMVTARLREFGVKRLLVDNGSTEVILGLGTFLKIGLGFNSLIPCTRTFTKFAGNEVTIMGVISLPFSKLLHGVSLTRKVTLGKHVTWDH